MKAWHRQLRREESGFTLTEVLVTIMILTVVLFSLYGIFDMSLRVFAYGNDKLEAVENARIGLQKMEREIRAAYPVADASGSSTTHLFFNTSDPETPAMPTVSQITFGNELGSPGDDDITCPNVSSCEYITYRLSGNMLMRNATATGSTPGSGDQPIIEFVDPAGPNNGLKFTYLDANGDAAVDQANIDRVRIALDVLVDGGQRDGTQTLTTEVELRNQNVASTPGDSDGDGVPDDSDACPDEVGDQADGCPTPADGDADGIPDASDNCPAASNPDQVDLDTDDIGDACDDDRDGDGVPNSADDCPDSNNPGDGCPATGISVDDPSVTEGNSGTKNLTFTVTRNGNLGRTSTVQYATANGSASSGSDYAATSGMLTFSPNETTKTVTVLVNGDTTVEPNETLTLNLSSPTRATIADSQGIGTITNDDAAPTLPTISVNDQSITEGNSGTKNLTFTVTRAGSTAGVSTVQYDTANVSATSGTDYTTASGALTFAAGETTKTVTVQVKGDTTIEGTETFELRLSSPTNATISDGTGIGTITNDDVASQCSDGVDNGPRADGKTDHPADGGCSSSTDNSENQRPTAVSDSGTVDNDVARFDFSGLLADDTDTDGDTLTVTGNTQPRDSGGTQRGTVTVASNGSGRYIPQNNTWTGVVTFTYTISDGKGGVDVGTVTLTITQ